MKKIETLAEYQQLASRTCPDLGDKNAIHMQLGILTEIGETLDIFKKKIAYGKEIDFVNLGEELADQLWYVANNSLINKDTQFCIITIKEMYTVVKDNFIIPQSTDKKIITSIGLLIGLNNAVISTKEFNYANYLASIYALCLIWELDLFQILTNNINKLKVRYPEKFDEEKAIKRDLEAERTELEK